MIKNIADEIREKSEIYLKKENLKRNWFLPVSVISYCILNQLFPILHPESSIICFILSILVASFFTDILKSARKINKYIKIYSFIGAILLSYIGSINIFEIFYTGTWTMIYFRFSDLILSLGIPPEKVKYVIFVILSILFIFTVLLLYLYIGFFLDMFLKLFKKYILPLIQNLDRWEKITYIIIFIFQALLVIYFYTVSKAGYGGETQNNLIYGMDSNTAFKIIYLKFWGNIKEPIFEIFAAPFLCYTYIFKLLVSYSSYAMVLQIIQLLFLSVTNIILFDMMKIKDKKIKFLSIIFIYACYSELMATIILEKYIFAYFYLIIFVYLKTKKIDSKTCKILPIAATGTMLTSMFFVPFLAENKINVDFKKWFKEMLEFAGTFLLALALFCKIDLFLNAYELLADEVQYVGIERTFFENICQFLNFIRGCFVAPKSKLIIFYKHLAWWLDDVNGIQIIGVALIFISIIGYLLNKNKYIAKISMLWAIFSLLVIGICGWGTADNETAIYMLYFAWAFQTLLILFINSLNSNIKNESIRYILYGIFLLIIICMFIYNIFAIRKIFYFGKSYCPNLLYFNK